MQTSLAALFLAFAVSAFAQETTRPVDLSTPTGTIRGSLRTPLGTAKGPVVLIIADSGPKDRDGNQPRFVNDSLRKLAAELAAEGFATLRYDKRGVGDSREAGPAEKDLRFDQYVEDATAWIAWLKANPRFPFVAVIGHGEGAHVGALAAAKAGAGAFVSIGGLARRPSDVLRTQLKPRLPEPLWAESQRILAALEKGETVAEVPKELMIVYRPSVQPYLISWFRNSPSEAIAKLDVPSLIVQGTADVQVAVTEGEALKEAARRGTLLIVPDMSHVMKRVTADPASAMKGLTDPTVPLAPELVPRIAQFLREAAGKGR